MSPRDGASARTPVRGPCLSDTELFAAIDPVARGLAAARVAAARGDYVAARHALASHLRSRSPVGWLQPTRLSSGTGYVVSEADDLLAGRLTVVGITHRFPGGRIDWHFNPTLAGDEYAPDHEWQWQLNRMSFWSTLGRAYETTGDERYARAFVSHLRSWVATCPRPDSVANSVGSPWRTIECGIRMSGSWPSGFHYFLASPFFTDDDVVLFVKSCVEHARYLRTYPTGGNWLTMEMNGLYTVGGMFPELAEATEWRSYAAQRLHGELGAQFLPDGAQMELTPGYHHVALHNILAVYDKAAVFGRLGELPSGYTSRAERAFDFQEFLMTPDRDCPRLNDSWPCDVPRSLRAAASLFPERADYTYIATDGAEGEPPRGTSHAFPWAGYYVMRSSWDRDANYLCFDAGPLGFGHVHQDKLAVVVWARGREILFDAGGGNYEESPWRTYDVDTFAHNTVLVDGLPQRRQTRDRRANVSQKPVDAVWESTARFDVAAASYDDSYGAEGNRPAAHHRRILYLKPDLFVVVDTLVPNDAAEHTYEARWHLASTATRRTDATLGVSTTDAGMPNLAVIPLLAQGLDVRAVTAQREPEILGWSVRRNERPQPATTVCHRRAGRSTHHFMTLLVPLRAADSADVVEVRPLGPLAAEARFADGRTVSVEADAEPRGRIRISETIRGGIRGRTVP